MTTAEGKGVGVSDGVLHRRMGAVASLRSVGAAAVPALERGLAHHPRSEVRRWCAHLLGRVRRRALAATIVAGTHDSVAAVRLLALQALAGGQDDLGLDPIPDLARQDRSKGVRRAALPQLTARLHDARARAVVGDVAADAATEPALRRDSLWLLRGQSPALPVATQR